MLQTLTICWALIASCLQDEEPEVRPATMVRLEMDASPSLIFEQQPFELTLRVIYDRELFDRCAIQLFGQTLQAPLQLQAPWIDSLEGTVALTREPADEDPRLATGETLSMALNDEIIRARRRPDRLLDGRTFTVLETTRILVPVEAGDLIIPAPLVRFAYATRFQEDFINGRVPLDRREGHVTGEALALRIEPLPDEGRPVQFDGAVGLFTVDAEAHPTTARVGETITVDLHFEGDGNLERFPAPALGDWPGLHLAGTIERITGRRRTVSYDLIPLDETVTHIPPIRFAFFSPAEPPHYEIAETSPIPLTVMAAGDGGTLAPKLAEEARRSIAGVNDIFDEVIDPSPRADTTASRPGVLGTLVALAIPLVFAFGLSRWLRRRDERRRDPAGVRAREAARRFRRRMARRNADLGGALAEYVAARLRTRDPAVIAPDLRFRLIAARIPPELAARTANLVERLVVTRLGAPPDGDRIDQPEVSSLVDALEGAFTELEDQA